MDKKQVMVYLAMILTTLVDLESSGPIPKSSIYMAMRMDINKYSTMESIMLDAGLCTVTSETISLTDKGRALGIKCNEAIAKKA